MFHRSSSLAIVPRLRFLLPLTVVVTAGVLVGGMLGPAVRGEEARVLPAPTLDEAPGRTKPGVAVLAGGCFWGVQGVYQHVKGVTKAVSGFAGGPPESAQYGLVSGGATGHAESVQVTYDPKQITYGQILQIYFSVAHDPTQLNRQGPDVGSQYRSAIFPTSGEQQKVAKAYIAQLKDARIFEAPIVTKIEPEPDFQVAEAYHQDYLVLHPQAPYIVINDLPKIEALKRLFPEVYRDEPVLVGKGK
jgi:peptide-methionine (S)-S-oxide reductase